MNEKLTLLETLPDADIISISKIIVSQSNEFSKRFMFITIDDAVQEAWKELIKYQSYFDPAKGKVTSWTYKLVHDALTSYAQREYNKTQKWDVIDDLPLQDFNVYGADLHCECTDLLEILRKVLSPKCYEYLLEIEKHPQICLPDLARKLKLSDRDVIYLRDELRATTKFVLGHK